jgi:hypothetical protein
MQSSLQHICPAGQQVSPQQLSPWAQHLFMQGV